MTPLAVISALAILGCGWWLATLFQSPEQIEAKATAPSPGPVFSTVTEGSLAEEHVFTGSIGPSSTLELSLLPAADAAMTVITGRAIREGDTVSNGAVLTEVNGRPVFLAQAAFPFYRDMGFGDRGPDVEALQRALTSAGYFVEPDGRFGAETAKALQSWYEGSGYVAIKRVRSETTSTRSSPSSPTDTVNEVGGAAHGATSDINSKPAEAPVVLEDAYMPVAEIVGMQASSARALRGVPVGTRVAVSGTADVVLGSSEVVVSVSATAAEVADLVEGDAATILLPSSEIKASVGTIAPSATDATEASPTDPAAGTVTDGTSTDTTFRVIPHSAFDVPTGVKQARVKVVKDVLSEPALLVPVLAITDRGSGNTFVLKRREDGTLGEVSIRILATLNGQVAISASAGSLLAGDEVRVG